MPPSSSPANTSVSVGTSGASCLAIARRSRGSDSKRYLSKYSADVAPDRSRKLPAMWATRTIARASSSRSMWVATVLRLGVWSKSGRRRGPPPLWSG
jgi:hypothetical protein